ncbi:hypothetical protein IM538_08800 [Cytobacillus suaedae]|nr:hypothetical protein IM538_08800 [Cytobacillus suaedae]
MFFKNIDNKARLYLISAFCVYVFSFISAFSIGLITVSIAFILLALGIATVFKWNKKPWQSFMIGLIGFCTWLILFRTIDDVYIFYPLAKLFS